MNLEWRPWGCQSDCCGNDVEVQTVSGEDNAAYDGEKARCMECGQLGTVQVDDHDGTGWIVWPHE